MRKPDPARLSARIRELRLIIGEYDRGGLVLGGRAVDALAERLRGFEIDAADLESARPPMRAVPSKLAQLPGSEIARRYGRERRMSA